jgi:hypothetical protein
MRKRQPPQDLLLSDAELRDVIERALRAEPKRGGVTIAELKEIAAELEIDPSALDRALDQVIGLPVPGKPIRSWLKRQMTRLGRLADSFLPQTGRLIGFGMFGAIAGWLNAFLPTFSFNPHYPIAAAMVGLTIANLLSRRLDQKLARFISETIATWILYGAAWSLTYGGVNDRIVVWVIFWASQACMLGYILMRDPSGPDVTSRVSNALTEPSSRDSSSDEVGMKRVGHAHPVLVWSSALRPLRGWSTALRELTSG